MFISKTRTQILDLCVTSRCNALSSQYVCMFFINISLKKRIDCRPDLLLMSIITIIICENDIFFSLSEQVFVILSICKKLQLRQLWLWQFREFRLCLYAMERTFFGPWSHDPRYPWSLICWLLLHLFPKINFFHWRLLFS